jgi:hypothetical protein
VSLPEIVYAAHTTSCTFLLDADGMCRRVLTRSRSAKESSIAKRCLGAQYVASLDMSSDAGLVEMPVPGAFLLFARVDDGRVALVKTAPLDRFEEVVADVRRRPDTSTTQRGFRTERMARPPAFDTIEDDLPDARTNELRAAQVSYGEVDEDTAPTGHRRGAPPATRPRPTGGVLPKRRR